MEKEVYDKALSTSSYKEFSRCFDHGCNRCSLAQHQEGYLPVVYRGNPDSQLVLIGEAPGLVEQKSRVPFTGPAGELLEKIFKAIGLSLDEDMLLTNVTLCRPTAPMDSNKQNYTPKAEQINKCWTTFGKKALDLLDPRVIIACGRTAMQTLFNDKSLALKYLEGKWTSVDDRNIFTMTHPASLLHQKDKVPIQEHRERKRQVWEYMKYFKETLPKNLV